MPPQQASNDAVVVILDYGPDYAKATISFRGPRRDRGVLAAKAEMVDGVKYVFTSLSSDEELEFSITDFHTQTREMAAKVVKDVVAALGLTVIKFKMEVNPRKPTTPGTRRLAHPAMPRQPHSRSRRKAR